MDRKVQGRAAARMQTRRRLYSLPMHRYHLLDLAKLNRHPKDVRAFDRWLSQAFNEIQAWLEHEAGIDESDYEFAAAVANRASQTARRLGAGDLALPLSSRRSHGETLELLGRLLAWCQVELAKLPDAGSEVTIAEAAQLLGIHPKTVRKHIADGTLAARDAAPASSKRPLFKLPIDAVLELRGSYAEAVQPVKPVRPVVGRVAKYTPTKFTLLD